LISTGAGYADQRRAIHDRLRDALVGQRCERGAIGDAEIAEQGPELGHGHVVVLITMSALMNTGRSCA
jgi:hypothetical protein